MGQLVKRLRPYGRAWMARKTPVRLVSMTACHASGFMRMMRPSLVMPALFTSTSTVPHASVASLNSLIRQPAHLPVQALPPPHLPDLAGIAPVSLAFRRASALCTVLPAFLATSEGREASSIVPHAVTWLGFEEDQRAVGACRVAARAPLNVGLLGQVCADDNGVAARGLDLRCNVLRRAR